jgi:hypothetical protein
MEEVCLMRNQARKLIDVCKLMIIFTTLTLFFYGMIVWTVEKIEPHQRYETPKGKATKVFQFQEVTSLENIEQFKNRLLFYYWFGE